MMKLFVIFLLALDLRVFGYKYPNLVAQNSKNVEVIVYNTLDEEKCPKITQPMCGTNGKEFLYFENKCHFEVKNYKMLIQGLMEYYECPLSYCKSSRCPTCDFVNEPVCAVDILTGVRKTFRNPCELKRRICKTRRDWRILNLRECNLALSSDCPEFCTLEYKPVCASFMGLEKEFSNECELKATICQTQQKWHIIRQGSCPPSIYKTVTEFYAIDSECPRVCALDYKPLCAKLHNKLKVFKNKCELENSKCLGYEWQIIKNGTCLEDGNNLEYMECPQFCTKEYRPLCAEYKGEQREFGNSCELLKALCETRAKWKVMKQNRCTSKAQNLPALADSCPSFCSREYKPVCAKLKSETREFANKCLLRKWNCHLDKKWEFVNMGPCSTDSNDLFSFESKCPQFCTREYRPVCAEFDSKLKEFGNKCELQKTICETEKNWKVVKEGQCPLAEQPENLCPKFCTKEFNPICASYNGELREFSNKCEFQKISCETNIAWKILKMGSCSSNPLLSCPQFCSAEYRPVCATYKSKLRLFKNECEMHKIVCETKTKWQFLKKGYCPYVTEANDSCPQFCTREFSPVCARSNGELREFSNSCELKKSSCETLNEWEVVNKGPCSVQQSGNPEESSCATEAFDPVCAQYDFNNKTFNNICQLAEEIKRTESNWSILHKGVCSNASPAIKASGATITNPTASIFQESTTTLKPAKYQTTEPVRRSGETISPPTTSNLRTRTEEYEKYSSIRPVTDSKNSSEEKKEDYNTSTTSSSQQNTIYSLNYSTDSGMETSSKWREEQVNTSHSYENKSSENYNNIKEKNYTDQYESYVKESEIISTLSDKRNSEKNYANAETAEDNYISEQKMLTTESSAGAYESKESMKYDDGLKNPKDKTYLENSKTRQENEDEKDSPKSLKRTDKKDAKTNKYINSRTFQATNYLNKTRLTKWIRKQIEALLSKTSDSQSYEDSVSDERELYNSHIAKHLSAISQSESDESLAANISNEDYGMQIDTSTNLKTLKETETDIEYLKHHEDSKYKNSPTQNQQTLPYNFENAKQFAANFTYKKENDLTSYENGNETLLSKKSQPLKNETTVSYLADEQHASKHNSSKPKKGEIYNGIVYKAPVYDAPTYNFIYTAPFNYHGLGPNNNDNAIAGLKNTSWVNQTISRAMKNNSPHPFHNFLSSLAAVNGGLGKPNVINNSLKSPNNKDVAQAHPAPQMVHPSASDNDFVSALASFNNSFNTKVAHESSKKLGPKINNGLTSVPSQVPSYFTAVPHHPSTPKQFAVPSVPVSVNSSNSPQISINSTLLNKIIETLKIITNRY